MGNSGEHGTVNSGDKDSSNHHWMRDLDLARCETDGPNEKTETILEIWILQKEISMRTLMRLKLR